MKRHGILLASALIAAAGASYGAMGPNRGLPQNWTMTAARGYGAVAGVQGNGASSMCVECHTVNPSQFIRDVELGGDFVVDRTNAAHRGSHFVVNTQAAGGAPWGITHSGGGFAGGFNDTFRDGGQYFRSGGWTATSWTGTTRSKFGNGTGPVSVYEGDGTSSAANADMICESCHNVVTNTATAADNDLILGTYEDNVNDGICVGCHAHDEVGATAAYTVFHTNDNLAAFAGTTTRKRHHVLTDDDLVDTLYGTGNNSTMWAPSASNRLAPGWCGAGAYSKIAPTINLDLTAGVQVSFRNACNVAGQGTRDAGSLGELLSDITVVNATTINCSNCHRPHNAMSSAGAFILRMGDTAKPDFTGVATGAFAGQTNANIMFGLRRQFDVGSYTAGKVYGDYRPLCAGCHVGY